MKNSTIIGLILGLVALIFGMYLKGAPLLALITNPAAYIIIIVGTVASICVAFPMSDLKKVPNLDVAKLEEKKDRIVFDE